LVALAGRAGIFTELRNGLSPVTCTPKLT